MNTPTSSQLVLPLLAIMLGGLMDFATDPFAWVGIAAVVMARKSAWVCDVREFGNWSLLVLGK